MTLIYTGPSDLPRDRDKALEIANAVEYRVGHFSPPKARVLKQWNTEANAANSEIKKIWSAWQAFTHRPHEIKKGHGAKILEGEAAANFGHFQETAENKRLWARIQEQAMHLGASYILLEPPPSFTPSETNKNRLRHFVREWASLDPTLSLIWRPSGFWDREESVELAHELQIILAIDPLIDQKERMPEGKIAYFQMLGRHGLLDSYSDDDLERILDKSQPYEEVFIIFRTRDAVSDTLRLRQILQHYVPLEDDEDPFDDDLFNDYEDEDYDEGEDYEEEDEEGEDL